MSELKPFIYILIFVAGMVVNTIALYLGYRFGFKAYIEARVQEDDLPEEKRLFANKTEIAEFELLEDGDRKEEDEDDDSD